MFDSGSVSKDIWLVYLRVSLDSNLFGNTYYKQLQNRELYFPEFDIPDKYSNANSLVIILIFI